MRLRQRVTRHSECADRVKWLVDSTWACTIWEQTCLKHSKQWLAQIGKFWDLGQTIFINHVHCFKLKKTKTVPEQLRRLDLDHRQYLPIPALCHSYEYWWCYEVQYIPTYGLWKVTASFSMRWKFIYFFVTFSLSKGKWAIQPITVQPIRAEHRSLIYCYTDF